jgi:hypothetical protein
VVEECVEGLGRCLRGEQGDAAVRKQIIQTLYDVYDFDSGLENDEPVMSSRVPSMLVRWTTLEERLMVATWLREAFDLDIDWHADEVSDSEDFDDLLLGLEADTIDDETFLRICRETESYDYLIDRLLKRGQLEEALVEAKKVDDFKILEIADILSENRYEDQAVQLIKERADQNSHTDLLHWLQERYEARGDPEAALDTAKRSFTTHFLEATKAAEENYPRRAIEICQRYVNTLIEWRGRGITRSRASI